MVWLLAGAAPAMAQGVGSIGGTVVDTSGAVLPGVTVTLTLEGGGVGSGQTAVTNEQGAYQFTRLVPGTYSVRAELQGFRSVEQRNISVNSDQVSRADFKLEIGTLEESITVSGQSPLLDTSTGLRQTVISREALEALPNRTDVWSISRVIPGVVLNKLDVGGTEQFLQSSASVRGTADENKFTIDGMDVSALDGNATIAALYLDPYAFQETNFMMGAGSAENSNGGLTFNMVTRSGTNQFRGGAMYNGTDRGTRQLEELHRRTWRRSCWPRCRRRRWRPIPTSSPNADIQKMSDAGAWLAGPVVQNKLWFAGTFHDQRLDSYKLGSYNPDGTQVLDDNIMWTTTAKATWQMSRKRSAVVLLQPAVQADRPSRRRHLRRRARAQLQRQVPDRQPGEVQLDVRLQQGVRRHLQPLPRRRCLRIAAGSEARRHRDDSTRRRRRAKWPCRPIAPSACSATRCARRSAGSRASTTSRRGYEYVNATRTSRFWSTSGLRANFANGVPTSVNTYLVQVTQSDTTYGADISELFRYHADEHGLFIQDRWTPIAKARPESRIALRDELELSAGHLPAA